MPVSPEVDSPVSVPSIEKPIPPPSFNDAELIQLQKAFYIASAECFQQGAQYFQNQQRLQNLKRRKLEKELAEPPSSHCGII